MSVAQLIARSTHREREQPQCCLRFERQIGALFDHVFDVDEGLACFHQPGYRVPVPGDGRLCVGLAHGRTPSHWSRHRRKSETVRDPYLELATMAASTSSVRTLIASCV